MLNDYVLQNFLFQQEVQQHVKENCVWQTISCGSFYFWPVSQNPTTVSRSINNVRLCSHKITSSHQHQPLTGLDHQRTRHLNSQTPSDRLHKKKAPEKLI